MPDRQRSLWAAIDWSWELLPAWARGAFAQCGVFRGGFSLDDFARVVQLEQGAPAALDALDELIAWSLVRLVRAEGDELRFGLLETLREYAVHRLDDPSVHERHAAWALAAAVPRWRRAHTAGDPEALGWLARERDNLLAAYAWLRARDPEGAATLAGTLEPLLTIEGASGRMVELAESLGEVLDVIGPRPAGWLLWAQGRALSRVGALREGRAVLERASERAAVSDDPLLRAEIANTLGFTLWNLGERDAALPILDEALEQARAAGFPSREATVLSTIGVVHGYLDEARGAGHLLDALALVRESGDRLEESRILGNLANLRLRQGRRDTALTLQREALALHLAIGDRRGEARTRMNLANALLEAGDVGEAATTYEAAAALARSLGERLIEAGALGNLAMALGEMVLLDDAEAAARRALRVHRAQGNSPKIASVEGFLGLLAERAGRFEEADERLQTAQQEMQRAGLRIAEAYLGLSRAPLLARRGDVEGALQICDEAVTLFGPGNELGQVLVELVRAAVIAQRDPVAGREVLARFRGEVEAPAFAARWALERLSSLVE